MTKKEFSKNNEDWKIQVDRKTHVFWFWCWTLFLTCFLYLTFLKRSKFERKGAKIDTHRHTHTQPDTDRQRATGGRPLFAAGALTINTALFCLATAVFSMKNASCVLGHVAFTWAVLSGLMVDGDAFCLERGEHGGVYVWTVFWWTAFRHQNSLGWLKLMKICGVAGGKCHFVLGKNDVSAVHGCSFSKQRGNEWYGSGRK